MAARKSKGSNKKHIKSSQKLWTNRDWIEKTFTSTNHAERPQIKKDRNSAAPDREDFTYHVVKQDVVILNDSWTTMETTY